MLECCQTEGNSRAGVQETLQELWASAGSEEISMQICDAVDGRHSNIPRCCIRYFIEVWAFIYQETDLPDGPWEYIPCPACRASGRVVKIHICGIRCGYYCREYLVRQLRQEFMLSAPKPTESEFQSFLTVCKELGVDPVQEGYQRAHERVSKMLELMALQLQGMGI